MPSMKAAELLQAEQRESASLKLSGAGRASMLPSGFLRQRHASAAASPRPLTELTGDPDVFRQLRELLECRPGLLVLYELHDGSFPRTAILAPHGPPHPLVAVVSGLGPRPVPAGSTLGRPLEDRRQDSRS